MWRVRGYSLLELNVSLAISCLLLLTLSSLLVGLHKQVATELKRAQLSLQVGQINQFLFSEFRRGGRGVSQAISVSDDLVGVMYFDDRGYQRTAIRSQGSKLKVCSDHRLLSVPLESVCEEVVNFSMFNDKLISLNGFEASEITSGAIKFDYKLRFKGEMDLHHFSLFLVPRGAVSRD